MKARLTGACLVLALSACAGAPKKSASGPVAVPASGEVARAGPASSHRKRSPYAPAKEDPSKRGDYTRGGLYAPHIQDSAPDDPLHDVDRIPEPEVVAEPRSRYGNRSPYKVLGKSYTVRDSAEGYVEQGMASYYGNKFHGRRTSNLEVYDMYAFTAAHKSLPLPSFARVTNLENGKSVVVRVNDRGPFHAGRVIDLSYAAAVKLGYRDKGTTRVEVRGLAPGDGPPGNTAREPYDAVATMDRQIVEPSGAGTLQLPPGVRIATGKPVRPDGRSPGAAGSSMDDSAMDKLVGLLPVAAANAGERPPQVASASTSPGREWRFDMRQDGKAMTADEFDAWMRSRRARVATGKPTASPSGAGSSSPPATTSEAPAAGDDRVTLQVASFANPQNADHALAMLRDARIAGARLSDAQVNGQRVYRLRVGPVDAAGATELAARVAGLGFGTPQRVRD